MEFWPTNIRKSGESSSRKRKEKEKPSGYPLLEPGRLEAINLVETNERLQWTSPFRVFKDRIRATESVKVFPSTRPPLQIPNTSVSQRAEQSANFLRTYLPDVDITADLVRNELSADDTIMRALNRYDPLQGNLLEVCQKSSQGPTFLAFPMGEMECDLNLSPVISVEDDLCLRVNAVPIRSFLTPLQQIVSSPFVDQNILAIRTLGSTFLLRMNDELSELASITRDDVECPVADISFCLESREPIICNSRGGVYRCNFYNGQKSLRRAYTSNVEPTSQFWKLESIAGAGCLLASEKNVDELDFRTTNTAVELFEVSQTREYLTSIEGSVDNHIVRLSSTAQVLWMDRRMPRKPMLAFKHKRRWDRSLAIRTLKTNEGDFHTLLTSRRNTVVTVYDVGRSSEGLLHAYNVPYVVPADGEDAPFLGQAILQLPGFAASFFRLSSQNSIYRTDLTSADAMRVPTFEWSREVHNLDKTSNSLKPHLGPLDMMEYAEADLRPLYDSTFTSHWKEDISREQEAAEETYELIEAIPSFWQRADPILEHALTTYDVVFRSGKEPVPGSRADFLTEGVFNSTRGYRAIAQNRFPMEDLKAKAPWYHNISSTIEIFDPSSAGDLHAIFGHLQHFNLSVAQEHPAQARIRKYENKACEQLTLDLTLSKDVFAPKIFRSPAIEKELETLTEALSIGSDGPVANFHYLDPIRRTNSHYDKMDHDEHLLIPLGVRTLLKDWTIGTDSVEVAHRYSGKAEQLKEKPRPRENPKAFLSSQPVTRSKVQAYEIQSQPPIFQPPPVVTAMEKEQLPSSRSFVENAQQSQEMMASTQILPGPFGARPNLNAKKKAGKKRMGGF